MKSKWLRSTLALLLTGSMILSTAVTVKAEEADLTTTAVTTGKTYYVDSKNGNDENSGTLEAKAFKTLDKVNELDLEPGDRVLLKAGSVFEDQWLHFTKEDSGSEKAPVIISTYGEGDRPVINTNGKGRWEQNYGQCLDNKNHKWHGTVSSCILIEDTEYIEISGLEMTNMMGDGSMTVLASDGTTEVDYNDANAMDRTGVAGIAQNNGTVDHIVLDDLYIHHIKGNVYNKHMCNGGIYFVVQKPADESATGIARYNDVQIKNCYLDTVNRWGIAVGYTYQHAQFNGAYLSDQTMSTYGSSNVVIENNYLNHVGGDAITTMYLDRSIVQYNVAENIAEQINNDQYTAAQPVLNEDGSDSGSKQNVGAGRVAAGIWPWKCKDAVFQFNECFNVLNASNGNGDGQPWDADYGDGTLYQYNYSHSNTSSTIMFCGPRESVDTTFRYNISVREDQGPLDPAANAGNAHVYNNTFIIKEGINSIWNSYHGNTGPLTCENNIFYFEGDTPQTVENWNISQNKVYDNNLYYNVSNYPNDEHAVKVSAGTKIFENVDSAPTKPTENGKSRFTDGKPNSTAFDGLKLAANSPAINEGKVITDLNRTAYTASNTRDFFGNEITAIPEIGAAESAVKGDYVISSAKYTMDHSEHLISGLEKNTTLNTFLKNIRKDMGVTVTVKNGDAALTASDMVKGGMTVVASYEGTEVQYTIQASTDATVKSSYYEIKDSNIYIPFTTNNPTTVSAVRQNVKGVDTATVSVLREGSALGNGETVQAGDTVRITAEDGTTTTDYTIVQKNEYNWTKDYTGPEAGNEGVQGPVWFAQQKSANTAKWTDLTAKDPGNWPNWYLDGSWPVGVAGGTGGINRETDHGLIGSSKSTDAAMTFRASASGHVQFAIRDTDAEQTANTSNGGAKEPYFRQNNANTAKGDRNTVLKVEVYKSGQDEPKIVDSVTLTAGTANVSVADRWVNGKTGFADIVVERGDYIRVATYTTGNDGSSTIHITPTITYLDSAVAVEDSIAPETPEAVRTAETTKTSVKVAWEEALDNVVVTGYNVYYKELGVSSRAIDGYTLANETPLGAEARSYTLEGLNSGSEYAVVVTAIDGIGNESEAQKDAVTFSTLADKTALTAAVSEAEAVMAEESKYTEESFAPFKEAVNAAKELLEDANATQEELDAAKNAIATAKAALVVKTTTDGDGDNTGDNNNNTGDNNNNTGDNNNNTGDNNNNTGNNNNNTGNNNNSNNNSNNNNSNNNSNNNNSNSSSNNSNSNKHNSSSSSASSSQASGATGAKTGDSAKMGIWVVVLVVAAAAAVALLVMKRKNDGQADAGETSAAEETPAPAEAEEPKEEKTETPANES